MRCEKQAHREKLYDQELYEEMQPVYYDNYAEEQQRSDKNIQNLIRGA